MSHNTSKIELGLGLLAVGLAMGSGFTLGLASLGGPIEIFTRRTRLEMNLVKHRREF